MARNARTSTSCAGNASSLSRTCTPPTVAQSFRLATCGSNGERQAKKNHSFRRAYLVFPPEQKEEEKNGTCCAGNKIIYSSLPRRKLTSAAHKRGSGQTRRGMQAVWYSPRPARQTSGIGRQAKLGVCPHGCWADKICTYVRFVRYDDMMTAR